MTGELHSDRVELFRLLGDEGRLQALALCAEEALTVSELAELLKDSQPQLTRKTQPLRQAGLLDARRDGTRTYLSTVASAAADPVVAAAIEEGRRLCRKDKSLSRLPGILVAREARSRSFFDDTVDVPVAPSATLPWLPLLRPLLGARANGLVVDVGAGDGALLPMLSPLFARAFAVERSPARLAQCAEVVRQHALANVRLLSGDAADPAIFEEVTRAGGAATVVVARTLHHAARPADLLASCARLLRDDGILVVVDYLVHDDERMREQGDVWLGFAPQTLAEYLRSSGLMVTAAADMDAVAGLSDSHLSWHWTAAARPPHSMSRTLVDGSTPSTSTSLH